MLAELGAAQRPGLGHGALLFSLRHQIRERRSGRVNRPDLLQLFERDGEVARRERPAGRSQQRDELLLRRHPGGLCR